jgi:AraC family transcriptional regulator
MVQCAGMNSAVERAINHIWDQYGEHLTLSDLANSAILSRFHFSRIFKEATGVSPGRFLSAVRICQAKRLLLTTSLNVTDICFAVGFNSLGSFTNHFTDSVGVSPSRFRRLPENGGFTLPRPQLDPLVSGTVAGTVSLPKGFAVARMYVGIFDTQIVQRHPACATVLEIDSRTGRCAYHLVGAPEGCGFLHAVAVADSVDPEPWTRRVLLTSGASPVQVTAGAVTEVSISMRPQRKTDLPVLLALPDLEPECDTFQSAAAMQMPIEAPASVRLAS